MCLRNLLGKGGELYGNYKVLKNEKENKTLFSNITTRYVLPSSNLNEIIVQSQVISFMLPDRARFAAPGL
jgi:hypothetical protein